MKLAWGKMSYSQMERVCDGEIQAATTEEWRLEAFLLPFLPRIVAILIEPVGRAVMVVEDRLGWQHQQNGKKIMLEHRPFGIGGKSSSRTTGIESTSTNGGLEELSSKM